MPTKSHHRARSSVDHVLELLQVLPEEEIAQLLDDFNHTTASNVPVAEAIALFDPGKPKPRRILRASSPVRRLEAELVRRNSKRISSAPEPTMRPRAVSPPPPPSPAPQPVPQLTAAKAPQAAPELVPDFRPTRPSLTLSPPDAFERPRTADTTSSARSWSYKRISRPFILSPTAQAELHDLLLAYICETPDSAPTTATPSPVTPHAASIFSPFGRTQSDREGPGLDLLEPSPARAPHLAFGRGRKECTESMSGIFEILASH